MSYPSYPTGGAPGYPPQPGYPGQPPAAGYPGQPQPGHPPQPGYPSQAPQPGYPSAAPGFPTPGGAPAPYPSAGPPQPGGSAPIGFAGAAHAMSAFRTPHSGHPPAGGPAPYPGGPPGGAPYPGGGPPPAAAPYPGQPGGAMPPTTSPYPAGPAFPGAPAAAGPYPSAGAPPAASPYPSAGAPPAASPYPSAGAPPAASPYPTAGAPPAAAPYGAQPPPVAQPSYPQHAAAPGHGVQPPTAAMAGMSMSKAAKTGPERRPSVRAASKFDKEQDAQAIKKAMKGFGCDEKAIITTLAHRSVAQRVEVRNHFKTMFGKDLMEELTRELHGHLETAVLALLRDPIEYDCFSLYNAMKGAGTNEKCLIEILVTRNNAQKQAIKQRYVTMYKKDLEKAIKSETSGHFERLLVSLLSATRDETTTTDVAKAKADAQTLYKAGEARWGTDEAAFNYIFASRNFAQLRLIFEEYSKISKYDIEKSIHREMSGDLKDGMVAIVAMVRDTPGFFAERLYKAMKGLGTDDETLVRVVVTRCEVDMEDVKVRFQQEYKKSLRSFIEGDTSGNYRRMLLTLINDGGY